MVLTVNVQQDHFLCEKTWTVFFLYSIMKMYFIMQNYIPQYETFGKNSCQEESR